jgi:hypothetical protein
MFSLIKIKNKMSTNWNISDYWKIYKDDKINSNLYPLPYNIWCNILKQKRNANFYDKPIEVSFQPKIEENKI